MHSDGSSSAGRVREERVRSVGDKGELVGVGNRRDERELLVERRQSGSQPGKARGGEGERSAHGLDISPLGPSWRSNLHMRPFSLDQRGSGLDPNKRCGTDHSCAFALLIDRPTLHQTR